MSNTVQLPTISPLPGTNAVADINTAFAAVAGFFQGATAPTTSNTGLTSTAGLLWHDTSNNLLKLRDQADTTWMPVKAIDETNKFVTPGNGILYSGATITPGGRLTLTSNTPVMNTDATAQTTIYYTPYINDQIMLYNGSYFAINAFTQISLALDSNSGHSGYQVSGSLFDLFVFNNSGTLTLGTGPAWTNSTTRSAAISLLNGIWTNSASITLRFGTASGNTVSVSTNQATYVGTMYATANGQTGMQFRPTAAAGGANAFLGLYNAYNRVRTLSSSRDSTTSWTYTTGTWRAADGNNNNRITFVDGLQQSFIEAGYFASGVGNGSNGMFVGMNLDSTTATPNTQGVMVASAAGTTHPRDVFDPVLGLHFLQAMENGATGATFVGSVQMQLTISLEM